MRRKEQTKAKKKKAKSQTRKSASGHTGKERRDRRKGPVKPPKVEEQTRSNTEPQ